MSTRKIIAFLLPLLIGAAVTCLAQGGVYLRDYIERALASNLTIKQALANIEQVQAAKAEAKSRFFPTLDFSARYTRAGGGREIVIDPSKFISGSLPPGIELGDPVAVKLVREEEQDTHLSLAQPLFMGGLIRNAYNAKNMELAAAQAELTVTRESIALEVARGYYQYALTRRLVDISRENQNLTDEHLKVAKGLFEAERVPKNEIYRAEVGVSGTSQTLSEAENNSRLAMLYFNKIINDPPEQEISLYEQADLSDDSVQLPEPLKELSYYKSRAHDNRAELKQVMYQRDALAFLEKARRAEYLPQLSLGASYGWEGEEYNFNLSHDYWNISLMLKFNIFDFGGKKARVRQARARIKQIDYVCDDLTRAIDLQVSQAYYNLDNILKKWQAAKARQKSAEENYRIIDVQYQNGLASQIQFLDGQNSLMSARSNLAVVYYQMLIAKAELEHACGTILAEYSSSD